MSDLNEKIKEYFNKPVPKLSQSQLDEIKEKVRENKSTSNVEALRRVACIAALFIVAIIPAITLPLTLNQTKYYAEHSLELVQVDKEKVENIVKNKYNQYSFVYEEYKNVFSMGYYSPHKKEQLLAVIQNFKREDAPYTNFTFYLVMSDSFIYSLHDTFIFNASITKEGNKTIYYTKEAAPSRKVKVLVQDKNYRLYLDFDKEDTNLIEKFL